MGVIIMLDAITAPTLCSAVILLQPQHKQSHSFIGVVKENHEPVARNCYCQSYINSYLSEYIHVHLLKLSTRELMVTIFITVTWFQQSMSVILGRNSIFFDRRKIYFPRFINRLFLSVNYSNSREGHSLFVIAFFFFLTNRNNTAFFFFL